MRKALLTLMLFVAALAGPASLAFGTSPPVINPPFQIGNPKSEPTIRELFVPFEDLHVLLENQPERVLLTRAEYQDLLARAKKTADSRAPREALLASADYAATAGDERAEIAGTLSVSVLEDGLHALGLDLAGVGLRGAALDGKPAALGLADDGRLTLFVEGKGTHKLTLDLVAPIQTTAARQILNFRLPMPAAAKLTLTAPGDVEVKSGAAVVRRTFDEKAGVTHIELLPPRGDVSLVMTLNSRLKRKDRVVVARSVIVDEVTGGYERLHTTVSMGVLHRAVDQFRFAVPAGFEVTDVRSPNLARWAIAEEGGRRVLTVHLREETVETVVLNLSAIRTGPDLAKWALPRFEPLDTVGHVAVVCLAVEDRLKAEAIAAEGLIRIDTSVLASALPATVLEAQPGDARLRPVVAYYAPQSEFALSARFVKPPARLRVVTNVLAVVQDAGLEVRGGFALTPEEEKLFAFDFSVPAGWDVLTVTGDGDERIAFERYGAAGAARVHVRLPAGVAAGAEKRIYFTAVNTPAKWLSDWSATAIDFPVFAVSGAARDEGAVAVDARDDMTVRPEALERLTPLDGNEKTKYGLAGVSAALAYRYEGQPYKARLAVERTLPRITAQTYSFFRVERDAIVAHYELVFDVSQARARRLSLVLPPGTPTALSIRGLGGVALKEYTSEMVGEKGQERRRWTATLADRRSGAVRLAVDFEQRLDSPEPKGLALPVVSADGVAYQAGLVAVEGSPELDVEITAHPRKVDIGELVDAEYQPGRRLLGAFGFLGDPPPVKVSVVRNPAYALPPAIVQRAELETALSADGTAQTWARFLLRTKALFLAIRLPAGSTLWSASLDGKPVKPNREGDVLLVNLPAAEGGAGGVRNLQFAYETPVGRLGFWRGVSAAAPRLALHAAAGAPAEDVPTADLQWRVYLPSGYQVVRAEGSVSTGEIAPPALALTSVGSILWQGSGGVDFSNGGLALILGLGASAMPRAYEARDKAAVATEDFYRADRESRGLQVPAPADGPMATNMVLNGGVISGSGGQVFKTRKGTLAMGGANTFTGAMVTDDARRELEVVGADGVTNLEMSGGVVDVNGHSAALPRDAASGRPVSRKAPTGGWDRGAEFSAVAPAAPAAPPPMVPLQTQLPRAMFEGTPKNIPGRPTGGVQYIANGGFAIAGGTLALHDGSRTVGVNSSAVSVAEAKPAGERRKVAWALEGMSSLIIPAVVSGDGVTFRSLGTEPSLELTIVDANRVEALAVGLALAVLAVGLALTTQPVRRKAAYVITVALAATLLPVVSGRIEIATAVNGAFYAACLLVPYYLAAGLARWMLARVRSLFGLNRTATTAALVLLAVAAACGSAAQATAAEAGADNRPYVVQIVPPSPPVKVPDDAIILPYDSASKTGIKDADRLLVPYDKFVALWNLAYPEKPIGAKEPPAPYALAGAEFTATLQGEEYLLVEGRIDLDVYTSGYATIPLPLGGGVLARADLDGKPARLSVTQAAPLPVPQADQPPQAAAQAQVPNAQFRVAPPRAFVVLYATGQGRHRLDVAVRLRLEKRGGWRVAEGRLPAAPATALSLTVPEAGTELRLGGVLDRRTYETKAAREVIRTALSAGGDLSIQWRPKVNEGQIDQTLTADSTAVFDVQEDSLRLAWSLHLEFRHGEREFFSVEVPPGYLVEKVEGQNVRGWELKPAAGRQTLEITLLKRTKTSEDLTITLWKQGGPVVPAPQRAVAKEPPAAEFSVPVVGVTGAQRHSGTLVIRRSPLLDLRTVTSSGVTRADLPGEAKNRDGKPAAGVESPLGIRPFQAYRFVAVPFDVRLAAEPIAPKVAATVQAILRLSQRERNLEARVLLRIENRPLYLARIVVPADLKLERVTAPGTFEWALTDDGGRKVLTVVLAAGVEKSCSIVIQGKLGEDRQTLEADLPRLEVLDVDRQEADLVVQVDPAFDVRADGLKNIEGVLLDRVFGWLTESQRALARLALHAARPDYAGRLTLTARKADVTCFTVTNARVTDRAIEEAILIDWSVKNAGIREVAFLLPAWMKDARIRVPLLRQKTITPVEGDAARVRVTLELQDEVMGQLRVLIENDRLLTGTPQEAPIPVVETGRTDRRYAAVESAGRDEVVVKAEGLDPLSRQQKEWAAVAGMLRGGMTQAFIVTPTAEAPRLVFHTKERAAVETVKARIGLAETVLVLDAHGAYRGRQVYRIDNRTEQFLEVLLPAGADLWTATVAGEPVKPVRLSEAARVRIPIIKTAAGDLDYAVVLKYAGRLDPLGAARQNIDFPLLRTVNINVELSQVQLYVPEDYVWFDFRGTMGAVAAEGDLEAGVLAYENRQADRLVQTLRSDNAFARARAMSNLKSVKDSIVTLNASNTFTGNSTLNAEMANSAAILQTADREVQCQAQAAQVTLKGNNDYLGETYVQQRNVRAQNLVGSLGDNWAMAAAPTPAKSADESGRFNKNWLESNRLETDKPADGKKDQAMLNKRMDFDFDGRQAQGKQMEAGQKGAAVDQVANKPAAQQMFQKFSMAEKSKSAAQQPQAGEQLRRSNEEVVQRYQQKYEQQQAGQSVVVGRMSGQQRGSLPDGVTLREGAVFAPNESVVMNGGAIATTAGRLTAADLDQTFARPARAPGGAGAAAAPAMPAGLASLDVQLPVRGRLYRFSTPRGEVEIAARAVSVSLLDGLERAGGVLAVLVVLGLVRRRLRGRPLTTEAQAILSTVLILAGIAGLMAGVFPLAALLTAAVGVAMKVVLFFARRRAAA